MGPGVNETEIKVLGMRRFAMAADYTRTNGVTTPLFSFAIAGVLWQWFPAWQVFTWAALASSFQLSMGLIAHLALKDQNDPNRADRWTRRLMSMAFVSGCVFSSVILLFYVPGERLNNMFLVAVAVACLATLAAMTAPHRGMMVASSAPFVAVICSVMLIHEAYPYNFILTGMAVLYCAETFVTSNKLSGMVGRMIGLQIGNDRLIASLAVEKDEADQARIRAERASRAKSNFLANMSHELRTPLNAILGFSEIIRDRVFGDQALPRYAAYANDIHGSGTHLLKLINDILDLSRIEAGKWELYEEPVALPGLLAEIERLHAAEARTRGVVLDWRCGPCPELLADRKALTQIMVNLASNAIKFTPKDGTVSLEAFQEGPEIVLRVTDTGSGIAEQDLPRIMERFGQARHDVAAVAQIGVGLGLPIVKGLAEAHGGSLVVESELGRGTKVTVRFPASRTLLGAQAA